MTSSHVCHMRILDLSPHPPHPINNQPDLQYFVMACRECVSGALHEGIPTGREETIHGLPTYVSEPTSGPVKGIIVIIPDGLGWTFNNSRILADTYAKRTNSRVYLPDFMDGHAMSVSLIAHYDAVAGQGWMIGKVWVDTLVLAVTGC